jgi:hypothetical protein
MDTKWWQSLHQNHGWGCLSYIQYMFIYLYAYIYTYYVYIHVNMYTHKFDILNQNIANHNTLQHDKIRIIEQHIIS